MSRDIIQQLKTLKQAAVNPRGQWAAENRRLLVAQIRNTVPARRQPSPVTTIWAGLAVFLPQRLVYSVIRPMAVLIIVALVSTTSWVLTVDASYETLPGDWLYPAKRAAEKTQVIVVTLLGNKNKETKLHVELAKRRAIETKKIVRAGDPAKVAKLTATVNDLKSEINTVSTALGSSASGAATQIGAEAAKEVEQNTEQINTVLQDVKTDLLVIAPGAAGRTAAELSAQVADAKNLVKDVSVKAVEVMVVKHLEGDTSLTKKEVTETLTKTLEQAKIDVGESKENVAGVKAVVEAAKSEVNDRNRKEIKADARTAETKQLAEKISQVANQTVAATIKTEVVNEQVARKVDAAKVSVEQGDLLTGVTALKEASQATKEAEKISDTTIQKVQTVLPVVQVIKEVESSTTITPTTVPAVLPAVREIMPFIVSTTLQNSVIGTTTGTTMMSSTVPVANVPQPVIR